VIALWYTPTVILNHMTGTGGFLNQILGNPPYQRGETAMPQCPKCKMYFRVPEGDDQATATREAPAAILAKLRQAVADLEKIVEVGT
jgi:hypothetical protein